MINNGKHKDLSEWIDHLQSNGEYSFSNKEVKSAFPLVSILLLRNALYRLVKKGRIVSIYKGFYIIIPVEYSSKGIVPVTRFIGALMQYLRRDYYISMLNAAMFYGASHQQPQLFYVVTGLPNMRPIQKNELKIIFISKTKIRKEFVETRKSEVGYIQVSSPLLTAVDLIQYEKKIGGMNRVAIVLEELTETIELEQINTNFLQQTSVSIIQRLGFLWETVLSYNSHSERLWTECQKLNMVFYRIALKNNRLIKGKSSSNRWNVIDNVIFDINE